MPHDFINEFYYLDFTKIDGCPYAKPSPADAYDRLASWAGRARGVNPAVFDALTEWIQDDSEWVDVKLAENETFFMRGVLEKFKNQNALLRARLKELEPPGVVKKMQKDFTVESFEYKKMPAMRFVGCECEEHEGVGRRRQIMRTLDELSEYRSGFDNDVLFGHHFGQSVDSGPWHGYWGQFMAADAPVPDGFVHFDLTPDAVGEAGPPFVSQFARKFFLTAATTSALPTRSA